MTANFSCEDAGRRALLLGLLAPPLAWSQTPAAPAELAQALPQAQLQGQGLFRYFGLAIYQARLWTAPGFVGDKFAQHALALELQYQRALEGQQIAERSLTEIKRQGPVSAAQASNWLAHMQAAFPDVKKNDRITGIFEPGAGIHFYVNGSTRSDVRDSEFARRFMGIWLSNSTSAPALRLALLGIPP
jgi:hypothetical protein